MHRPAIPGKITCPDRPHTLAQSRVDARREIEKSSGAIAYGTLGPAAWSLGMAFAFLDAGPAVKVAASSRTGQVPGLDASVIAAREI
jgi:hypothetical protein